MKKLQEMGDCFEDIDLSIYETIDLMNLAVKKLLDFKKFVTSIEVNPNEKDFKKVELMSKDLQKFIKKDCGSFNIIVDYIDFIVERSVDLNKYNKIK